MYGQRTFGLFPVPVVTYTANEMGLQAEGGLVKVWHVPLKHLALKARPLCTVQIQGGSVILYAQEDMIITDIYCDAGNTFATHMPLFTGSIIQGHTDQPHRAKDTFDTRTVYRNSGAGKVEVVGSANKNTRSPINTDAFNGQLNRHTTETNSRMSSTTRDTSYRNKGALTKEYLGTSPEIDVDQISGTPQQALSTSNTDHKNQQSVHTTSTYRNPGAGKVEVVGSANKNTRSPINVDAFNGQIDRQPTASNSSSPIIKQFAFNTSTTHFAYGKLSHWTKETGSKYLKNEIICHIKCFTSSNGVAYTETIRAPIDLVIEEKFVAVKDRIQKGSALFLYRIVVEVAQREQDKPDKLKENQESGASGKLFAYKTFSNIVFCTGKSENEVRNAINHLGCKEPFSLVDADRLAFRLTGDPSIRRAWNSVNNSQFGNKVQHSASSVLGTPESNDLIAPQIEGVDEFLSMVRNGYAFQVRDVLERIVNAEKERIETERGLWKLGAGLAALAFGVSVDGFDAGDLLSGWAFSNIGGAAHQFASKEQVEFLRKLQSEWLVLDRSPMDIRRRLGEPQGRFIGISRENRLDMFNIHQSGSRGFHMVELDFAGNIAKGFKNPQSLEVLQRSYDQEDMGIISGQLYPSNITALKLCRTITPEEAKKKDPYYNQLSKAGAPFRVVYSDDTEGVMYKIQIPHHSDY